jgi:hypothetical protein
MATDGYSEATEDIVELMAVPLEHFSTISLKSFCTD